MLRNRSRSAIVWLARILGLHPSDLGSSPRGGSLCFAIAVLLVPRLLFLREAEQRQLLSSGTPPWAARLPHCSHCLRYPFSLVLFLFLLSLTLSFLFFSLLGFFFFFRPRASKRRSNSIFLSPLSKHLASIGLVTRASTSSARHHEAGNGVAYSTLRVGCSLSLSLFHGQAPLFLRSGCERL